MNLSRPPDLRLRAREVFFVALDQPDAAGRARLVAAECQADADLQRHVERLLDDHFSDDGFMATPAGGQLQDSLPDEAPGARIGRYRIVRKLGEGGMGVVYLAEQEEPVRRQVALKIIKLGMDTRQVVARFEAERQALAMMDHPNIAKILDAGVTGEGAESEISNFKSEISKGRPYFVMELAPGVPITEHCQAHHRSLEERLQLFISVCHALQHAHQKGIIHRDLKPSNVLVALSDGKPTPKVIDFGVAKAINQRLTERTLFTNVGALIGTPAYMSPEQAELSGLDVDTRSDIYSLGVLLYELLTGGPPFPEQRLRKAPFAEMQRIILEEEPERPSLRLRKTALAGSASSLITRHSSLSPDLESIVMKCLEKDRALRYDTASALAADLERYLANEPILARPPSAADRARKWIRRNRVPFAALVVVATVLAVATAVSTWQALRATRAQRAFQEQAEIAQSVKNFLLNQLLGSGDSWEGRTFDTNNRALVYRIAGEIEGQFANQPIVEAEIRQALGNMMNWMDDFPESLAQVEKAYAIRKLHLGPAHSDTLISASEVGYNLYNLGRHREGDQVLHEAIAAARAASQMTTRGAAEVNFSRGWKLSFDGRPAEAMPYLREALDGFESALGESSSRASAGRFVIAAATHQLGQLTEAERLFQAGLRDCLRFHGTNHTMTANFLKGYGLLLIDLERYDEAIQNFELSIAIQRQFPAFGPNNLYLLEVESYLARALEKKGEIEKAVRHHRDLLQRYAIHRSNYRAHRRIRDLAEFFVRQRLYADAEAAYSELRKALIEVPPQQPAEFEKLLRATAAVEGWSAAAELCRRHFDEFSDSLSAWRMKAAVFCYVRDAENYRETVRRVLALSSIPSTQVNPNEEHILIEIAGMGANDLSPAERAEIQKKAAALEAALPDRSPELQRAGYRAIALFQLRFEQFSDCLKTLEKPALGQDEPDAGTLFLRALCLNRLGGKKEAQAALEAGNALVREREITPESARYLSLADLYPLLVVQSEAQAELAAH